MQAYLDLATGWIIIDLAGAELTGDDLRIMRKMNGTNETRTGLFITTWTPRNAKLTACLIGSNRIDPIGEYGISDLDGRLNDSLMALLRPPRVICSRETRLRKIKSLVRDIDASIERGDINDWGDVLRLRIFYEAAMIAIGPDNPCKVICAKSAESSIPLVWGKINGLPIDLELFRPNKQLYRTVFWIRSGISGAA